MKRLNPEELDTLQHTIGADKYGDVKHERNYFIKMLANGIGPEDIGTKEDWLPGGVHM